MRRDSPCNWQRTRRQRLSAPHGALEEAAGGDEPRGHAAAPFAVRGKERDAEPLNPADTAAVDAAMSDPLIPLITAAAFVGVGWLIIHAGRQYDDAIRHTLTVFALVFGLLVLIGVTAKLRSMMGVGRMLHRIEARSQVDPPNPVRTVRKLDAGLNP